MTPDPERKLTLLELLLLIGVMWFFILLLAWSCST